MSSAKKSLELNRRLCPEIYLEVVPINKSNTIKINGSGETVEYALKDEAAAPRTNHDRAT